ncbi:uncharacterized protein BDV14DRAFT_197457 [Aspergillus stella-maris]|uniref:uncharacterized protein n=1 Tax=Aspergillus stella-maris TaxID=1810926 RepID=UPI003CCD611F
MEDSEQQEPIFELATECENLYASQITKLNDVGDQNASRLLSDVYQRFAAWAAFLGVFAEAKVCLDRRLRRHVEIQDQVLRLLGIMQRNLSKLFDDSVSMDGDNIQSIAQHAPLSQHRAVNVQSLEAISAALQRLHQLATAIQRSSVTSQTLKARELAATFDLTYFEQVANLLIRTLYTEASACLIELLTQSMAETYALFLHRKRRQQQLQTRRLAPQAPLSLALIAEETDGFDGSVVMDSEQEALHVQDDSSSNMVPAPPPLRLSHVPQSEPTSLDCQELNAHIRRLTSVSARNGVGGSSAESGSESSQTNHQTSWVSTEPRSLDRAMSDMWSEPLPEMGGDLHPDNVAYTMEDVPDSDPIDWHDILGSPIHTAENAHGHAINMGPLHRPAPLIQDNNTETSARGIVSRPAGRKFPIDVDDDDFMVIGIDFGTTYSGVSWATVADFTRNKINLITSWPGTDREEGKAPTELFYEDNQIFWGYEIPDGADPVRWFKLLLVKNEDLSEETRSSELILRGRKMLKETGKTVVGLIADYLRLLWSHILKHLKKSRGEFVVNALRFHVVITIPAIWKGYARQGMEEAARQAGLLSSRPAGETTLSFVLEPEAAALSTLCEPGHQAQPGDLYVICDAGGGTVDLISYKITSVNPIVMHEAVEGTGGLCGGILIDEAFERACKSRLGRLWNHLSKAGIKEIVKDQWENAIKPQFKPQSSKKEYTVSIPAEAFRENSLDDMNREPYIKKGRIHFSSLHIQEAFTETFAAIDKLIDGQINKAKSQSLTIKGIILVGGLGASPYLYEHLKDRHASTGITILQSGGMRPRTAICQGAVYKGFLSSSSSDSSGAQQTNYSIAAPISVISTISRTSLGVVYKTPFDSSKHLKKDKFWYPHEGEWFAEKQIKWYLKRGDNISTTNPLRHSFYHLYEHEFYGSFTVELFRCEKQDPPTRLDKSVVRHCKIDCTLDVPWEQLEDFISANTGTMIKKMSFDLEMVPSGASVLFVVYINGRWQGSQIANPETSAPREFSTRVAIAAVWVLYAGHAMFKSVVVCTEPFTEHIGGCFAPKELYHGPVFGIERRRFWTARLKSICEDGSGDAERALTPEARGLGLQAVQTMEALAETVDEVEG